MVNKISPSAKYVHSEHHIISEAKRQVPIYRHILRSSEHNSYYVHSSPCKKIYNGVESHKTISKWKTLLLIADQVLI